MEGEEERVRQTERDGERQGRRSYIQDNFFELNDMGIRVETPQSLNLS